MWYLINPKPIHNSDNNFSFTSDKKSKVKAAKEIFLLLSEYIENANSTKLYFSIQKHNTKYNFLGHKKIDNNFQTSNDVKYISKKRNNNNINGGGIIKYDSLYHVPILWVYNPFTYNDEKYTLDIFKKTVEIKGLVLQLSNKI